MKDSFEISQEVKAALGRNHPVVALESSVIAQGLPGKKGAEAALEMIREIRKEDCTPAVIGIIEGRVKVGLSEEEIARLAVSADVMKCSTRELAEAVAAKRDGATTVAATAYLAHGSGIPVMATGGIGGVHRGASASWDVSADLWELAKTPIVVVCSGAKGVLDLPATLQWLETHQVAVYGLATEEFPAFYSSKSGLSVPKLNDPGKVSELYAARLALGLRTGMVIGVPITKKDAVDLSSQIDQAIAEAAAAGVAGAALTPWLLNRVQELSGGKAIDANIALLKNNARMAAKIAAALVNQDEKRIGFGV